MWLSEHMSLSDCVLPWCVPHLSPSPQLLHHRPFKEPFTWSAAAFTLGTGEAQRGMGTCLRSHSKLELVGTKPQDGHTYLHDYTHILGKSSLLSNHTRFAAAST